GDTESIYSQCRYTGVGAPVDRTYQGHKKLSSGERHGAQLLPPPGSHGRGSARSAFVARPPAALGAPPRPAAARRARTGTGQAGRLIRTISAHRLPPPSAGANGIGPGTPARGRFASGRR